MSKTNVVTTTYKNNDYAVWEICGTQDNTEQHMLLAARATVGCVVTCAFDETHIAYENRGSYIVKQITTILAV